MRSVALLAASIVFAIGCSRPATEPEAEGSTDSLIIGGKVAAVSDWEGMIQTENDDEGPWCGATLIARDWAVSAAHCVSDQLPQGGFQRVVLGRQRSTDQTGESIDVDDVIRHEAYDPSNNHNDIVLLHLAQKSTHKPVRLVTKMEWTKLSAAGTSVTVIGWGATREGSGMSNTLREVTVPIVDTSTCNGQYDGIITKNQVCAGLLQGGKDSCQGDSGGPLFQTVAGEKMQVGIVSFGEGCARANLAGVYTSVAAYRDWIETNTKGAVPAEPKVEPPPKETTPDNTTEDTSSEDTGSATDTPPSKQTPETTDGDDDDDTTSAAGDDDDAPKTTSSSKKKSTRSAAAGPQAGGCEMGRGRSEIGMEGRVLLVLAAFVGLLLRRQHKKKQDAEAAASGSARRAPEPMTPAGKKPRRMKLRLGRGGVVKHKSPRPT